MDAHHAEIAEIECKFSKAITKLEDCASSTRTECRRTECSTATELRVAQAYSTDDEFGDAIQAVSSITSPRVSAMTTEEEAARRAQDETYAQRLALKLKSGDALTLHPMRGSQERLSHRRSIGAYFGDKQSLGQKQMNSIRSVKEHGLAALIQSVQADAFFAILIFINTALMALEAQYEGLQIGHSIGFYPTKKAEDIWPGADLIFLKASFVIGVLFALELILKMVILRFRFLSDKWNWFDTFIVLTWLIDQLLYERMPVNPTLLRLSRIFRVLRVVRLFKSIQAFDSLHVLLRSIKASLSIFIWASLLISFFITICGLFLSVFMFDYFKENGRSMETRHLIYGFVGTFSRSTFTLFQATLGSVRPVMSAFIDNVGESWGVFFMIYKCIVGFAVVRVISGVFLHETFRIANTDDEIMVRKGSRDVQMHMKKMSLLFNSASLGNGTITFEEFQHLVSAPAVKTWLAAYELRSDDAQSLFKLLDNGDGQLTVEELVQGVSALKGPAKSLDMHAVKKEILKLKACLRDIRSELPRLAFAIAERQRDQVDMIAL